MRRSVQFSEYVEDVPTRVELEDPVKPDSGGRAVQCARSPGRETRWTCRKCRGVGKLPGIHRSHEAGTLLQH